MTKFLHTCVRVKDLEASLKFYKEALGFKEARSNDFPEYKFTLVYLQLEDDPDYELELTYNYDHEAYDLGDGVRAVGPPSPRTNAEAERSSPPRTAETSSGTRQFSMAEIGFLVVLLLRMRIAAAICR